MRRFLGPVREALVISNFALYQGDKKSSQKLLNGIDLNENEIERFVVNVMGDEFDLGADHFRDTRRIMRSIPDPKIYQFLSVGRSGTFSLANLFEGIENYKEMHHVPFPISGAIISEMFYRGVLGQFEKPVRMYAQNSLSSFYDIYFRSRCVEFTHASIAAVMILNHWEAWFSPIVSKMFPTARFVYLRRNPVDAIFSHLNSHSSDESLSLSEFREWAFEKKQNVSEEDIVLSSNNWCMNVYRNENGDQICFEAVPSSPFEIAKWHYKTIEILARCLKRHLARERVIEISSDRLFAADLAEVRKLMSFVDIPVELEDRVRSHFGEKINEKKKKLNWNDETEAKKTIRFMLEQDKYWQDRSPAHLG